jgi:hypothetical protein
MNIIVVNLALVALYPAFWSPSPLRGGATCRLISRSRCPGTQTT